MRTPLTITTLILAAALALTGCSNSPQGDANDPTVAAPVATTPAAAPTPTTATIGGAGHENACQTYVDFFNNGSSEYELLTSAPKFATDVFAAVSTDCIMSKGPESSFTDTNYRYEAFVPMNTDAISTALTGDGFTKGDPFKKQPDEGECVWANYTAPSDFMDTKFSVASGYLPTDNVAGFFVGTETADQC